MKMSTAAPCPAGGRVLRVRANGIPIDGSRRHQTMTTATAVALLMLLAAVAAAGSAAAAGSSSRRVQQRAEGLLEMRQLLDSYGVHMSDAEAVVRLYDHIRQLYDREQEEAAAAAARRRQQQSAKSAAEVVGGGGSGLEQSPPAAAAGYTTFNFARFGRR